jgi:hypothetical protein
MQSSLIVPRSVDPHQWAIAERKRTVKQALTSDWQTSTEIAGQVGLTLQSTCRLLDSLARDGSVERDWNSWKDEKGRFRGNWLYRKPTDFQWERYPKWLMMQAVE